MVNKPFHYSSVAVVGKKLAINIDSSIFQCPCLAYARKLLIQRFCFDFGGMIDVFK